MRGEYIETITLEVELQQNGIIRQKKDGYLIGRLSSNCRTFEEIKEIEAFTMKEEK